MTALLHGVAPEVRTWQDRAACRQADPDLFFEPGREDPAARLERETTAKRVCARCPVRAECLTTAIDNDERWGIWGGLTRTERTTLLAAEQGTAAGPATPHTSTRYPPGSRQAHDRDGCRCRPCRAVKVADRAAIRAHRTIREAS